MNSDNNTPSTPVPPDAAPRPLSDRDRYVILVTAFLGWMLAGVQLAVSSLVMRDAAKSLLASTDEALLGLWFGRLTGAFLLGAASGGYLFGWVGDRLGRARAMALSIIVYSVFAGFTYFVREPWQLLVLRFVTCMGVGGMWPNGIALLSEAWPNVSRPFTAGIIGTAANVGIMLFSTLACFVYITDEHWRWVMVLCTIPVLLGLFVWAAVPESPRWLAVRGRPTTDSRRASPLVEIFHPPLLKVTIIGIALGTVPLFGGWGNSNWANAWASQVGERSRTENASAASEAPRADPGLKGRVLLARSAPGSLSSLLGGALAWYLGRRRCYFLLSAAALFCAQYMFWFSHPADSQFLFWTGALGFFSGFFFGWLPLCLPELFPTRVRSTGAGVSFNFGRIVTAFGVLIAAELLEELFDGDYAQIGRATSLIYAVGMVVIWFAPDTSTKELED